MTEQFSDPYTDLLRSLKEEIAYLREQNKELTSRVMAFSGQAHHAFLNKDIAAIKVPAPTYLDEITGKIESMDATTEEEEKQKSQAQEMLERMLAP